MPQMLSRVRTISNDLDTALVKTAKTAPLEHHRSGAPGDASDARGKKS